MHAEANPFAGGISSSTRHGPNINHARGSVPPYSGTQGSGLCTHLLHVLCWFGQRHAQSPVANLGNRIQEQTISVIHRPTGLMIFMTYKLSSKGNFVDV